MNLPVARDNRSQPASFDITVLLSTYNRSRDLAGALESIAKSEIPDSVRWEILVVDNNSSDDTPKIVEQFGERYPARFRYQFEPRPGKSYALNTGIESARGEVLAFVDDDVTVEPAWLQELTAELLRDQGWAGAGGRTLPAEKFIPPPWLRKDMQGWGEIVFAHFDMGDLAGRLMRPPYGANMAFRRSILRKHGGFRVDLGPSPGSQIRNEDTELGRRLLAAGERLRYEPAAIVYHPIPHERIRKDYFFSWWFDYGRAMIKERRNPPSVYGIPRDYLAFICRVAEMSVFGLGAMLDPAPAERFRYKCRVWRNKGQISEIRRRRLERKRVGTAGKAETVGQSSRS